MKTLKITLIVVLLIISQSFAYATVKPSEKQLIGSIPLGCNSDRG